VPCPFHSVNIGGVIEDGDTDGRAPRPCRESQTRRGLAKSGDIQNHAAFI
jgi:hypothetical protein